MAKLICSGAMAACSGSAGGVPVPFFVPPAKGVLAGGAAAATVYDGNAKINLPSFGACGMSQPQQPCVPELAPRFVAGSPTVLIGNCPALHVPSTLSCAKGGIISFQLPGQFSVEVP